MTSDRRERVLRSYARQLARELGRTEEQVLGELREAIAAGLLKVTRTGLQATIPAEDKK